MFLALDSCSLSLSLPLLASWEHSAQAEVWTKARKLGPPAHKTSGNNSRGPSRNKEQSYTERLAAAVVENTRNLSKSIAFRL